ncbi:MAG TPA: ELWxxDGT repeat protein [Gemmataceae bacterium]|nr:ELWxxDGT repeat protein [Gemmataceae bacterium]
MPTSRPARLTLLSLEDRLAPAANLVADVNTAPDAGGSEPALLSLFPGNKVLFRAKDKTHGEELWVTDGTTAGTTLVNDVYAGALPGAPINGLVTSGDLGYFTANSQTRLGALWRTDGTKAGTFPLDISPSFFDTWTAPFDGGLYFLKGNGATNDLMKTDGTEAGTVVVGSFPSLEGFPYDLTMVGDTLYFGLSGPGTTEELWKATGGGATRVQGGFTSQPIHLTAAGTTLYFTGTDAAGGAEVWKADSGGAVRVADVRPGATGSSPANFTPSGGRVFFTADDGTNGVELWATDGTVAGTYLVTNIGSGSNSANPKLLADWNGSVYFAVQSGIFSPQLWKSDGTAGGTTMVHNFNAAFGAEIRAIQAVHGGLYVAASDGTAGTYLWKTDGTTTSLVKDIGVIFQTSAKAAFFPVAGGFVFVGGDDTSGAEMWFSDGTPAGTRLVKDIWGGTRDISFGTGSSFPTAVGNRLFFTSANPPSVRPDLWAIDGTTGSAALVRAFQNSGLAMTPPEHLTAVGNRLFFTAADTAAGTGLWTSDGTPAGTTLVQARTVGAGTTALTAVGDTLFFRGFDAATSYQVYKSDGTAAGTGIVKTINGTAFSGADPSQLTAANGLLYFVANDGTTGYELWRSDGTEAGTVLVTDLRPGSTGSSPSQLTPVGGLLYFTATDATGAGLWKTDGTPGGTVLVSRNAGSQMTAAGGKVYFVRGSQGNDLWVSDGTAAGTVAVPGGANTFASGLTAANGKLFFQSGVMVGFGQEPWVSDGTAAGTFRLLDIAPGPEHSAPVGFRAFGGHVYFSAWNRDSGRDLWRSDGTTAGTVLIEDLIPGPGDARPAGLIPAGPRLYFTATDEAHGKEWWVYKESPVARADSYPAATEDVPLSAPAPGVLANDGVGGAGLTAAVAAGPSHGSLTLNPDGSFQYVPDPDFFGTDTFTYTASDGTETSSPATVTITVQPVNDRPVAAPDAFSVGEDGTLTIPAGGVLLNDDDPDGDTLSAEPVTGPAHGDLALNANGSFTYSPDPDYNGPDSFVYIATDGSLDSDPVSVTLTVSAVNDAPVAAGESYSLDEDGVLAIGAPGVTANDLDVDGDSLSAALVSGPAHGDLLFNADGSFTYTPDPNFNGPDGFTYRVSDGTADSNVVAVSLAVAPVNDPPVATDDSATVVLRKSVTIPVLANDSDVDGDGLSVGSFTQPTKGTVKRIGNTFVYTATGPLAGADGFTYTLSDGRGGSATGTVHLTLTDPVAPSVTVVQIRYGLFGVASLAGLGRTVVPWTDVNLVEVAFTEAVVLSGSSLTLTGPTGAVPLTFTAGTRSGAWTFAALPAGRYTLRLTGAAVLDVNGNAVAQDYVRSFAVLPGDFDGNGLVDGRDASGIKKKFQKNPLKANRFADINGDGVVNQADLNVATGNKKRSV